MKDLYIEKSPKTFHRNLETLLRQIPPQVQEKLRNRPGLNYGMKLETKDGPHVSVYEHLEENVVDLEHDLRSPQDDWIEKLYDETPVCLVCGKPMEWFDDWDTSFSNGSVPSDTYGCTNWDCHTFISYTFNETRRFRITLRKLASA